MIKLIKVAYIIMKVTIDTYEAKSLWFSKQKGSFTISIPIAIRNLVFCFSSLFLD